MTSSSPLDHVLGAKNDRLKRLRRLVRQRKARSIERAFVAEGPVLVIEALRAASAEVIEVYAEEPVDPGVEEAAAEAGLAVQRVANGGLGSVLDTVSPQPVCAVVRTPERSLDQLPTDGPILVVADLRDPGNVGTLMRTAEAAGFAALVVAGDVVDPTNPKVVRASAGAVFRLPVAIAGTVDAAYEAARASGRTVVATVVDVDAESYDQIDLTSAAIVLGNEAHGLDPHAASTADRRVTIPLAGPTESLNVAAAGAVLCFESLRQRRPGPTAR